MFGVDQAVGMVFMLINQAIREWQMYKNNKEQIAILEHHKAVLQKLINDNPILKKRKLTDQEKETFDFILEGLKQEIRNSYGKAAEVARKVNSGMNEMSMVLNQINLFFTNLQSGRQEENFEKVLKGIDQLNTAVIETSEESIGNSALSNDELRATLARINQERSGSLYKKMQKENLYLPYIAFIENIKEARKPKAPKKLIEIKNDLTLFIKERFGEKLTEKNFLFFLLLAVVCIELRLPSEMLATLAKVKPYQYLFMDAILWRFLSAIEKYLLLSKDKTESDCDKIVLDIHRDLLSLFVDLTFENNKNLEKNSELNLQTLLLYIIKTGRSASIFSQSENPSELSEAEKLNDLFRPHQKLIDANPQLSYEYAKFVVKLAMHCRSIEIAKKDAFCTQAYRAFEKASAHKTTVHWQALAKNGMSDNKRRSFNKLLLAENLNLEFASSNLEGLAKANPKAFYLHVDTYIRKQKPLWYSDLREIKKFAEKFIDAAKNIIAITPPVKDYIYGLANVIIISNLLFVKPESDETTQDEALNLAKRSFTMLRKYACWKCKEASSSALYTEQLLFKFLEYAQQKRKLSPVKYQQFLAECEPIARHSESAARSSKMDYFNSSREKMYFFQNMRRAGSSSSSGSRSQDSISQGISRTNSSSSGSSEGGRAPNSYNLGS